MNTTGKVFKCYGQMMEDYVTDPELNNRGNYRIPVLMYLEVFILLRQSFLMNMILQSSLHLYPVQFIMMVLICVILKKMVQV